MPHERFIILWRITRTSTDPESISSQKILLCLSPEAPHSKVLHVEKIFAKDCGKELHVRKRELQKSYTSNKDLHVIKVSYKRTTSGKNSCKRVAREKGLHVGKRELQKTCTRRKDLHVEQRFARRKRVAKELLLGKYSHIECVTPRLI